MTRNNPVPQIKKIIPALVAAFGMSVFIGIAILAFGLNAFLNPPTTTAQAAGQQAAMPQVDPQVAADQVAIQDLQAQVSQYQTREAQYKQELQQAADQITQINQQNQQYQQLVAALQNAGVIQITQDGRVLLTSPSSFATQPRGDDD